MSHHEHKGFVMPDTACCAPQPGCCQFTHLLVGLHSQQLPRPPGV